MKCVSLLAVLAVVIPWEVTATDEVVYDGCRLGRRNDKDNNMGRRRFGDVDFKDEAAWRYVFSKWHMAKKFCRPVPKLPGPCKDHKNYQCLVCNGKSTEDECIKQGRVEECRRGQNACILEKSAEGLYFRRCGYKCECAKNKDLVCMNAGCASFGCASAGCEMSMANSPNWAYKDQWWGKMKCRCDNWCHEHMNCCSDVCDACPAFTTCMPMGGGDK